MKQFLCLFILFLTAGCSKAPETPKKTTEKPLILVSIAPYAYFVEKIADGTVQVATIVPAGVNMHVYEPTIQELTRARSAAIWFQIGEPFEKRIARVLKEHNPSMEMLELWKDLPLLIGETHDVCHHGHDEESSDMHTWMSPKLAALQCVSIALALSDLLPENVDLYAKKLSMLGEELGLLDEEIHAKLAPFSGNAILVSHPAYGYFCREYDLIQLSIECEGKDPRPKDIEKIFAEAQKAHVRAVFTQLGYNNKGAELMASKLGLPVHQIDPYAQNYLENMRAIADLIAK
jgi:zinc transport system substrate-binding protein